MVDTSSFSTCRVAAYYNRSHLRYSLLISDVELLVVTGGASTRGEWLYNVDNHLDMCMICVSWRVAMFHPCDQSCKLSCSNVRY